MYDKLSVEVVWEEFWERWRRTTTDRCWLVRINKIVHWGNTFSAALECPGSDWRVGIGTRTRTGLRARGISKIGPPYSGAAFVWVEKSRFLAEWRHEVSEGRHCVLSWVALGEARHLAWIKGLVSPPTPPKMSSPSAGKRRMDTDVIKLYPLPQTEAWNNKYVVRQEGKCILLCLTHSHTQTDTVRVEGPYSQKNAL